MLGLEDLCNSLRYVTLPYHPLEIAKLGVEHSGVFRRGGIGAAERSESPEARLMWIVGFDGLYLSLGRARIERI